MIARMFAIRSAADADVQLILQFIRDLAEYERLAHRVVATEETLRQSLFGSPRFAEVIVGEEDGAPVGFALFFHNYSTFLAKPGIYLEDLFVLETQRGAGIGKQLLARLAAIAVERDCGRLEWAVLDWNKDAIRFYEGLGAKPNSDWTVYRLAGESLRSLAGE